MFSEEQRGASLAFHSVASLFPKMGTKEYDSLKKDIEANGLREPIWTYEGHIIDGRHRYLACQELNLAARYQEWNGDGSLVLFVVSLNLERRHLTVSQRAMIAVEIERQLSLEAQQRRLANLKRGQTVPDVRLSEHRENGKSSVLAGRRAKIGKDAVH